jgi:Putative Actinobacterial Holin-X, holin superfamily III
MRTEAQLARTEMSEKISEIGAGFGLVIAGTVILIPALVMLLQGAVIALRRYGFEEIWASLIVGGAGTVLGLVLSAIGVSRLNTSRLVPNKTVEQIHRDASMAKNQVEMDYGPERTT